MQLDTYRYHGHHVGDINRDYYRSKEEEALWKNERDPIVNFGRWLTAEGLASAGELAAIDAEVKADADAAVAYALAAPFPEPSQVGRHVFTDMIVA